MADDFMILDSGKEPSQPIGGQLESLGFCAARAAVVTWAGARQSLWDPPGLQVSEMSNVFKAEASPLWFSHFPAQHFNGGAEMEVSQGLNQRA